MKLTSLVLRIWPYQLSSYFHGDRFGRFFLALAYIGKLFRTDIGSIPSTFGIILISTRAAVISSSQRDSQGKLTIFQAMGKANSPKFQVQIQNLYQNRYTKKSLKKSAELDGYARPDFSGF